MEDHDSDDVQEVKRPRRASSPDPIDGLSVRSTADTDPPHTALMRRRLEEKEKEKEKEKGKAKVVEVDNQVAEVVTGGDLEDDPIEDAGPSAGRPKGSKVQELIERFDKHPEKIKQIDLNKQPPNRKNGMKKRGVSVSPLSICKLQFEALTFSKSH